jgi:flagellar biosynthetic protein FlhB
MDLQLFAEERTEEATPRRLREARKEGRAARSQDLAAGIGLVAAAMALKSGAPGLYDRIAGAMTQTLATLGPQELTLTAVGTILQDWLLVAARALLPITLVILAIGLATGLLQGGLLFSAKPLTPDLNRINPLKGLGRIFSVHTVVDLIKALLKLALVGFVGYREISALVPAVPSLMGANLTAGIVVIATRVAGALQTIGMALTALGVLDYGYQYWEYRKSLRMTKQEVKQENRQQEGNPELKQKQRQRARDLARRRKALKEVPMADVVVTNPTHFAVAIRYKAGVDAAPLVVAKGADLLAQRIKVLARQHAVPTVENRPLARALYSTVEIGRKVPPELYTAVAEVLAFVYSLRRTERRNATPTEMR